MSKVDHAELQQMVIRLHDIGRDSQIITFRDIADSLSNLEKYLRSRTGPVLNSAQKGMESINRPAKAES